MKIGLKILSVSAFFLTLTLTSCKKIVEIASVVTPAPLPTTPSPPPPPKERIIELGTGSGNLVIDGLKLGLKCNDVIQIVGGSYTMISVKNINIGCTVKIKNKGLVQIAGNRDHWNISNVSNLIISGSGDQNIEKGFLSKSNPNHRSIILSGAINDFTLEKFSFVDIGDYVIYYVYSNQPYRSSDESSYSKNLRFLNNDCSNTGTFLQIDGGTENGELTRVIKNLEIAHLNFKNSNCGNIIFVGNADDYDIHHNIVDNMNGNNNNHNGIFTIKGSGAFHHNLVKNHQGNAIRAWARSLGSTPKEVLIYKNTVFNSRKYSAFEVQSFANEIIPGKTTYSNIKVYDNLCGNLNLSKDWVGVVLDLYSLFGGKCEVYNNTGFNFPAPNAASTIVNIQSATSTDLSNNKYYKSANEAGILDVNALSIQN